MKCKTIILGALLALLPSCAMAQGWTGVDKEIVEKWNPLDSLSYSVEIQGSVSHGRTPLWLNANKYGLSSLDKTNGYVRGSVFRSLSVDDGRKFGLGYAVDVAVPVNYTSKVVLQQAYVEGRWLHGSLTVGAKEEPMQLKNAFLSSGSQTNGINARPVPQVRLALPDYWAVPLTRGWLHLKGHFAFGILTDGNWEADFTNLQHRYTDKVLYHSKSGYLKIGNEERFCPWSLELGLEMVTLFGGTIYSPDSTGAMQQMKAGSGISDYWHAIFGGGSDAGEVIYKNIEGDMLGSWVARLNYDGDWSSFSLYADKFFEDHSAMFLMDYDGYGTGDEWQVKKKHRYLIYDLKDWMLGFEYNYKPDSWLNDFVFEYLYTKYQSGPIYHDHTAAIADHLGGKDNFYNHSFYASYQHWGQVMGNPLYRSPIYNTDGTLDVKNNRFVAFHLGLGGHPNDYLRWRMLATWQEGWGTYDIPYTKKHHNVSLLGETSYRLHNLRARVLNGVTVKAGIGADFGSILNGPNYGFQLTITKTGLLKF